MTTKFSLVIYIALLGIFYSCKKENDTVRLQADFVTELEVIRVGEAVTFSDISTGNIIKWNWTFEGGNIEESVLSSPTVVFEQPGNYEVSLEISDGRGTSLLTKEIAVGYNSVEALFEADQTVIIQGDEVSFTDLSVGLIENWKWEFTSAEGVVVTSTEQHPKLHFNEVGIYQAKLTATNPDFSDVEIKENFIEVLDASNLSVDFTSSATGTYEGQSITFTASSVGSVNNWLWEFEGGSPATSTDENPTVTYSQPGRYKVKLSGTNIAVTKEKVREGYISVVPGDQLAAYFPFGGSLNDVGPHKFVPTVKGTITSAGIDRKTHENNAAVFNGSSGLVVADHAAMNFGTNDYSVSVWVKTTLTKRMMIWQESGDQGSGDNQTWLRLGANTTSQLVGFATEDSDGGSFLGMSEAEKGKLYDNVWHHVVATRSGLKTTVYIDGVKAKEVTSTKGIKNVSNGGDFKIGMQRGATNDSNYFDGMLDDLVIYNKALTAAEVAALYNF